MRFLSEQAFILKAFGKHLSYGMEKRNKGDY
jgi:hypothetical protein